MFWIVAILTVFFDSIMTIIYFSRPSLFGDPRELTLNQKLELSASIFDLVLLSIARVIVFAPYLYSFFQRRQLHCAILPITWELINAGVIVAKATMMLIDKTNFMNAQWLIIISSSLTILLQLSLLDHLRGGFNQYKDIFLSYVFEGGLDDAILAVEEGSTGEIRLICGDKDFGSDNMNKMSGLNQNSNNNNAKFEITIRPLRAKQHEKPTKNRWVVQMEKARNLWNQKLEYFRDLIQDISSSSIQKSDPCFDILVRLFAFDDVITELDDIFLRQPKRLEFYIPQVCSFFLYDSYHNSARLEKMLLKKCLESVAFAHKMYWFLNSFCTQGANITPDAINAVQKLMQEIAVRGERGAFLRVKCGRNSLQEKENWERFDPEKMELYSTRKELELEDDEEEKISGYKSLEMTQNRKYQLLKEDNNVLLNDEPITSHFFETISFINELTSISSKLGSVPDEQRNEALRKALVELNDKYLPSQAIYIPLGSHEHYVCRIISEESFTFSTRERVPFLVCLEVVGLPDIQSNPFCQQNFDLLTTSTKELHQRNDEKLNHNEYAHDLDHNQTQNLIPHWIKKSLHMGINSDEIQPRVQRSFSEDSSDTPTENEMGQWSNHNHNHSNHHLPHSFEIKSKDKKKVKSLTSSETITRQRIDSQDDFDAEKNINDEVDNDNDDDDEESDKSTNMVIFPERWSDKEARIKEISKASQNILSSTPYGTNVEWRLFPVIVKSGDDLRQEQFASQLLRQMHHILIEEDIHVFLRPYDIIAVSPDSGLIEAIHDTVSIHVLKKRDPNYTTLLDFFERRFGSQHSREFFIARQNFIRSLAAYSIVCYLLQLKDRHNGNILLDASGHLIHIDFGFMFDKTPGNVNFESAPFKLTYEFVDLMDGPGSIAFRKFRDLCVKTFLALRRQRHKIILLVEMMARGNEHLPCFSGRPEAVINALQKRFACELTDSEASELVHILIDRSLNNWRTRWYDHYQRCCVGIF